MISTHPSSRTSAAAATTTTTTTTTMAIIDDRNPSQQLPPPHSDGINIPRFRKNKAVKALRSILGLFHKAGNGGKSERLAESSNETMTSVQPLSEAHFTHKTFSPLGSPSCTDDFMTPTSDSSDRDSVSGSKTFSVESPAKSMCFRKKADDVCADNLSKIGNFDDDEFADRRPVDRKATHATTDDGDEVFLNESYFEDDYFEDFSGGDLGHDEDMDVKFPVFSPGKEDKERTESCNCYKPLNIFVADDFEAKEEVFSSGSGSSSSRKRHASMPCLKDWSSLPVADGDPDAPSKSVAHLLQGSSPYFTLGMDMVANHFGDNANVPDDRKTDNDVIDKVDLPKTTSNNDNDSVFLTGCPFQSVEGGDVSHNEETTERCRTPLKQTTSTVNNVIRTPSTPSKKPIGHNLDEAKSEPPSPSPNKRGRESRKNLYKHKRPSPLKVIGSSDADGSKRIADGLTAVAEWVMQVVALRGAKIDSEDVLSDSDVKENRESPLSSNSGPAVDQATLSKVHDNALAVKEKDGIPSPLSSDSAAFHSMSGDEDDAPGTQQASANKNQDNNNNNNNSNTKDIVATQIRSRLESGYASRSKCSTPSTPFSEPSTPMSQLHSGRVMSPQSLNKLDGLGNPQHDSTAPRQGGRSTKFLFPPRQQPHTSPSLRPVPEVTENTSNSSGVFEKSSCQSSRSEIDLNLDDVILSGGGDVESLVTSSSNNVGSTCSSSGGSAFWSATSTNIPRDPPVLAINIFDENNNPVHQTPLTHRIPVDDLPEVSSPAIKRLQPISTSSPLQAIEKTNHFNLIVPPDKHLSAHVIHGKQGDSLAMTPIRVDPEGKAQSNSEKDNGKKILKIRPRIPTEKKRKNVRSRSIRSARTCLRFGDRDDNSSEQVSEAERKPSDEYIVLKKVAKFALGLMPSRAKMRSYIDTPALMENLKENYLRIMRENNTYKGILFISQLKTAVMNNADGNSDTALTAKTCLDTFLLNILVQNKDKATSCADFIFENLPNVMRGNPAFLSLAPEIMTLLLDNNRCIVKGHNGFPLSYRTCEKEVLKVAVKFVEKCDRDNPHNTFRVQRLLHQVVDPNIFLNDVIPLISNKVDVTSLHVPTIVPPRAAHRISYSNSRRSHGNVNDSDVTASSKLMPPSSHPHPVTSQSFTSQNSSAQCATSQHSAADAVPWGDVTTLYRLTKQGTIDIEAPVDVQTICDEEHALKTIYFCYGSLQGVTHIADIGLQFVSKGRQKSTLFVASPSVPIPHATDTASPVPCSDPKPATSQPEAAMDNVTTNATTNPTTNPTTNATTNATTHVTTTATTTATTTNVTTTNATTTNAEGGASQGVESASAGSGGNSARSPNGGVQRIPVSAFVRYPVSEQPSPVPLKKAAMILSPGEHIIGVSVLTKSEILHNVEITTNNKRRVRAHALPAQLGAQWTKLQTPRQSENGVPFCLHALIGETRTSDSAGTQISGLEAVWAMPSWDPNDLSR